MRSRGNDSQPVAVVVPSAAVRSMSYQTTNSVTMSRTAPTALRTRPRLGLSIGAG